MAGDQRFSMADQIEHNSKLKQKLKSQINLMEIKAMFELKSSARQRKAVEKVTFVSNLHQLSTDREQPWYPSYLKQCQQS